MRIPHFIAAGGAAFLLAGCNLAPSYERPGVPLAAAYPTVASVADAASPAQPSWKNVFADERLQHLIELALANNLDLRVALLRVEQSRAQERVSRTDLLPSVSGGGSFTRSHAADRTVDSWSANVGATAYELDFFGRVRSLNRQALERYFATVEAQRATQITLVAEVGAQYFALLQAEAQAALAEETLAAARQSLALTRAKSDAGAGSELDVRSAEGQVQSAKINLLANRRQAAQSNHALALLLGQPLPADLPAGRAFGDGEPIAPVAPGLPSDLLQLRPDILRAEHTLKAAQADIAAARAAFFPSISLTGSLGTASAEFEQLLGSETGVWSFMPQIKVPLFNRGRLRAELDAAKLGERIEIANYQRTVQTAFREVADALVAGESYAAELAARAELIAAQRARLDLAQTRFRQGEDAYLNVLVAQQDLYAAEQGRLQARYRWLESRLALYRALGGGWR